MRDALLVALAFGDVVNDGNEILRLAVGILDRQPRRGDDAHAVARRGDPVLTLISHFAGIEGLSVFRHDRFDDGGRQDPRRRLADNRGTIDAKVFFRGAIDQQVFEIRCVLDDDR